jgi:hypothetical protein
MIQIVQIKKMILYLRNITIYNIKTTIVSIKNGISEKDRKQ